MSFQSPLALIGLVAIPLLVVVYVLAARRQRRAAGRFTNPALVPNLVPLVAAVAAVRPFRPRSRGTDAPRRGDRAPARRPLGHA